MMEEADDFTLVALEQELKDDLAGRRRDALLDQLETLARRIKRAMDAGVVPAEFERLRVQYGAAEAAAKVVAVVWRRYHPQ